MRLGPGPPESVRFRRDYFELTLETNRPHRAGITNIGPSEGELVRVLVTPNDGTLSVSPSAQGLPPRKTVYFDLLWTGTEPPPGGYEVWVEWKEKKATN